MAKSAEQRAKEKGIHVFQDDWDGETAKVRKDIDPTLYKTILSLTKRFDELDLKFRDADRRQGDVNDTFDEGKKELLRLDKEMKDWLEKTTTLAAEAFDSIKVASSDGPEGRLNSWEEHRKASDSLTQEFKIYFDKINKINESYDKSVADIVNKARSEIERTKGEMRKANDELNSLEAQIRSAALKCEAMAVKQDKPEAAKAVKAFLKAFGSM